MGFFDKNKKKETNIDIAENKQETEAKAERFTLVVESSYQLPEKEGIEVAGNLHGKAAVEDTVYIMYPNGKITASVIKGIKINNGIAVQSAENQSITIRLSDINDKLFVEKYSVLTSIQPQTVADVDKAVENGQLLGLSMEFNRFSKDSNFMTLFVYAACHAHFITPVYMNKEPENKGEGKAVFTERTIMRFFPLSHSSDPTKHYLPVFTDWTAFHKWKECFNKDLPPKVMILRFPDVAAIVKKDMNGAVINPFGPVPISLPDDYIERITSLEGYKLEFGNKDKKSTEQIKVPSEEQILVGIPAETEEVKLIRETIVSAVKPNADINQVYMLLKMDHMKNRSYFLVIDCDKETEKESYDQIASAVKPYLNEVKYLDIISYEQFGDRIKGMGEKGLIFDRATFWR